MSAVWQAVPGPGWALLTALAWAVAVILFKRSGESFDPVGLNAFKSLVAFVLLLITGPLIAEEWGALPGTTRWILALSGVVGVGIADTLFFMGLNILGASRQAIVDCAYAPVMVLLAAVGLGERLTWQHGLGGVLIVGAMLLVVVRAPEQTLSRRELAVGISCGLSGILLMGISLVAVKHLLERHDVVMTTTWRLGGGLASLVVLGILHGPSRRRMLGTLRPQVTWRYAVPGAFMGTYLSLLFWIAGFKFTSASVASILNQMSTVFIVLLAALFLREPVTPRKALAVLVGFAGSALVVS